MELSELQRWRKIVPATMFCAVVWPLGHAIISRFAPTVGVPNDSALLSLFLSVVAIPLAVIYDALDWRGLILRPYLREFWQRTESKLRIVIQNSGAVRGPLMETGDKRWRRVYYRQVDADATVSEMSKRIRDNGLALSSAADAILILGVGGLVVMGVAFFECRQELLVWSAILVVFAACNIPLLRKIASVHQALIDDQLLHVTSFRKAELVNDYQKVAGLD